MPEKNNTMILVESQNPPEGEMTRDSKALLMEDESNFVEGQGDVNDEYSKDSEIGFSKEEQSDEDDGSSEYNMPFKRRSSMENFGKFGLLTPALILVPAIDGSDALTQTFPDLQGENRELKLAAAHIDDAIKGRGRYGKARAIFKPRKAQFCFNILDTNWFRRVVLLAIIVHTSLIFAEPPPVNGTSLAVFILTALCLLVYIFDIILHIVFLTWPVFWSIPENRWIRVEFVFVCMLTVDFILLVIQEILQMRLVQPFRCLRAAMLLCKSRNVGHIYDVVLSIAVKLAKVFFVMLIFILLFSAVGLHLFVQDYHHIGCNITATANCTDDASNVYTGRSCYPLILRMLPVLFSLVCSYLLGYFCYWPLSLLC